ncbi:MAG: hypothetical protein AB2374_08065 [Cytobacillus gottheilii]
MTKEFEQLILTKQLSLMTWEYKRCEIKEVKQQIQTDIKLLIKALDYLI